jgi:hypothetical protein
MLENTLETLGNSKQNFTKEKVILIYTYNSRGHIAFLTNKIFLVELRIRQ